MTISYDFSNKKVIITGGSSGIGLAIVTELVALGAKVAAISRNKEKSQPIFSKISPNIMIVEADLSKPQEIEGIIPSVASSLGGLDILVCSAGQTKDKLAISTTLAEWNDIMNVNLNSNFILNREAAKIMSKAKYGRIINISSVVATTGNIGQASYASSKAGLIALTKTLALEFARRNITVNAIAPGFISTPLTDKLPDEAKESILKKIPLQRYGTPDEVAAAVIFLASEYASYITGTTLYVSGGL